MLETACAPWSSCLHLSIIKRAHLLTMSNAIIKSTNTAYMHCLWADAMLQGAQCIQRVLRCPLQKHTEMGVLVAPVPNQIYPFWHARDN
jgi:hypothetical protein